MRKIIYSLLGVAFLFSACEDRLDIEQKGVISFDSFFKMMMMHRMHSTISIQSFCLNIAGNEGIYVALPLLLDEAGMICWQQVICMVITTLVRRLTSSAMIHK
jgi:hypothetical protein